MRQAPAIVPEIASGVSTGVLIKNLADSINGIIDKATASGDFLMQRGAQESLYILDGFKAANTDLLDVAFDKIGEERQAVLNGIRAAASALEDGRVDTLAALESTTDQIDNLVRETTFKRRPTIFRYRGSLVVPNETAPVHIRVTGYRVAEGKPFLEFRGQRYEAHAEGNALRFELPRSHFKAPQKEIRIEDATVVLWQTPRWFWGRPIEVRSQIGVVTLPTDLATVEVSYDEEVETPHEELFSGEVSHNSSSRSWNCQNFAFSPRAADRRFDLTRTWVVDAQQGNRRGRLQDIQIKDTGISFRICCKKRMHDGDNGYRHARYQYVEVWSTKGMVTKTATQPVAWVSDAAFPVANSIEKLLVTVTDFSGNRRVVPAAGGMAGRYTKVTYDASSDVVIVSPVIPPELRAL